MRRALGYNGNGAHFRRTTDEVAKGGYQEFAFRDWSASDSWAGTRLIIVCFSAPARRLTARLHAKETTSMTIDVATGIARILKQEGVDWVSTFPVCRVNNALGREGVPMLMMRDDRYAVAVADAFSRITAGTAHRGLHLPGRRQCRRDAVRLCRDGAGLRGWLASSVHHRWRAGWQLGQQPVRCRIDHEDGVEMVRLSRQARAHA